MKGFLLKSGVLFFLQFLFSAGIHAQEWNFAYFQTEDFKPFYIKLDGKVWSSSSAGYIILPKITQNTLTIRIGFPQSSKVEYNATLYLNGTNIGYLLRNEPDHSRSMVHLVSMEPVLIEKQQQSFQDDEYITTKDEFARILSEVVNDSSIRKIRILKNTAIVTLKTDEKKSVNPVVAVKPDSIILVTTKVIADKAAIIKLSTVSTDQGLELIYVDKLQTAADTIKIFIPENKTEPVMVKAEPKAITKEESIKTAETRDETKFINMELQNPNSKPDSGELKKGDLVISQTKKDLAINSSAAREDSLVVLKKDTTLDNTKCRDTASQADYTVLRRKMASENSENEMNKIAIQQFVKTCFTTEQIKNLGVLYVEETGRYKFYLAAFPYVSDSGNFKTLESQFADENNKTRFKEIFSH
jgi:hypothetical protein